MVWAHEIAVLRRARSASETLNNKETWPARQDRWATDQLPLEAMLMPTRYYRIEEVPRRTFAGFEVLWSVVDDGKFPLRAFGPASLATCGEFVRLAQDGHSHRVARDLLFGARQHDRPRRRPGRRGWR